MVAYTAIPVENQQQQQQQQHPQLAFASEESSGDEAPSVAQQLGRSRAFPALLVCCALGALAISLSSQLASKGSADVDGIIQAEEKGTECTPNGGNCKDSKCCSEEGMTCYKKNKHWSGCNKTCDPYYKWHVDKWVKKEKVVWDCSVVQETTADASATSDTADEDGGDSGCSANGENCKDTKCCSEKGMTCYKLNKRWSVCNKTCDPYYKWHKDTWVKKEKGSWDCSVDKTTIAKENATDSDCVANEKNCNVAKCCSEKGMTCYKLNKHWSVCNKTCDPYYKWHKGTWVEQKKMISNCSVE